uniref:Early flowering protein n=1 Tax=Tetraselmis sp. GSL018 TaxID=582737 RepID=A0A061QJB6_9CHLO
MDVLEDSKLKWTGANNFSTVQGILDRNKLLINEINSNHESRSEEGLEKNFHLIKELNSNLAKIVELYKDISTSFAGLMEDEGKVQDDGQGA